MAAVTGDAIAPEVIEEVRSVSAGTLAATTLAHNVFQKWRVTKAKDRRKYLLRIADVIQKHGDELATIECLDAGQALRIVRAQIARAAENFSFYAAALSGLPAYVR